MLTVLDIDRESSQDGDRWLRQWVIGLLAAVVIGGGSWWATEIEERVSVQESRVNANSERLAAIESQLRSQEQRLNMIADGLKEASDRIDGKLDRMTAILMGQRGTVGSRRFD